MTFTIALWNKVTGDVHHKCSESDEGHGLWNDQYLYSACLAAYSILQQKVCFTDPLFGESTADGWIPLTKGHQKGCWNVLMPGARPLSIFRSNSKFDENSKHSSVKYTRPITTIFCTRYDSVTVVTCAKYRCDRSNMFEIRAFWIFIEFRIRSKYA